MADPVITPAAVAAPVSIPTTTAVEPVQTVIAPVAQADAPAQEVAPAVVVAPVEAAPVISEVKPADTLLGKAPEAPKPVEPVAPEIKPAEVEAVKETEGGQSVEPAPPPKYEAFEFPDGLKPNETKVAEFTSILSKLELEGKADHATVQKIGQELVNSYLTDIKKAAEGVSKYYQETWDKTKSDWREATVNDPEYGGNRLQTNLQAVQNFLNTHGGTAEQVAEFRNVMETTGLGNHPALFRLLVNVSQAYKEGTPLTANKPVQQTQSRVKTLYAKSQ